jgi:hypothetical protein
MTDIYDVPDFIPESTYKSQEKTSPREPLNLEKFMTDINELSVVVDDEKMKQNKKNYKAKEKKIDICKIKTIFVFFFMLRNPYFFLDALFLRLATSFFWKAVGLTPQGRTYSPE